MDESTPTLVLRKVDGLQKRVFAHKLGQALSLKLAPLLLHRSGTTAPYSTAHDTTEKSWVHFARAGGQGIGIGVGRNLYGETQLCRALHQVRIAHLLRELFVPGVFLRPGGSLPDEWEEVPTSVELAPFSLALSKECDHLVRLESHLATNDRCRTLSGRFGLELIVTELSSAEIGSTYEFGGGVTCLIRELGLTFKVEVLQEGRVMLEAEGGAEEANSRDIPVRLDLGTVEIPLEVVLQLRRGCSFEVELAPSSMCFLRIGREVFAEAALSIVDGRISLTVKEVRA